MTSSLKFRKFFPRKGVTGLNLFVAVLSVFALYLIVFTFRGTIFEVFGLESSSVNSSFSADYEVDETNKADVAIKIKLDNVGSNPTILTKYTLNLGYISPKNVVIKHEDQELNFESFESSGYVLRILLGEVLLRPEETYEVVVNYEIPNFFNTVGGSYEAVLPVFSISDNTTVGHIIFSYDDKFGPINYANTGYEQKASGGGNYFLTTFSGIDDLEHVVFSVGGEKWFGFDVEKKFVNNSEVFEQQSITFIPEFQGQTLYFSSISEYPQNTFRDNVGNIVMNFSVPPGEELWVRFRGNVLRDGEIANGADIEILPSQEKLKFLETDDKWWKIQDESILEDLDGLQEIDSEVDKLGWIYDYVLVNLNLSRNFRQEHEAENRKGAETSLKTYKNASAEDFADTFVALCRSADIPARVVTGFVFPYSTTGDNLGMYHVWPQYWDDDLGWVSADPAYEKYTGYPQKEVGLRRVVTYIVENEIAPTMFNTNSDDIFLTNNVIESSSKAEVSLKFPEKLDAGKRESGTILISNLGTDMLYWNGISISPGDLSVKVDDLAVDTIILPGETKQIEFSVMSEKWYVSGDKHVDFMIAVDDRDETFRERADLEVTVQALWWAEPASWVITIIFFVIVTLILYFAYKLLVKIFKFLIQIRNKRKRDV